MASAKVIEAEFDSCKVHSGDYDITGSEYDTSSPKQDHPPNYSANTSFVSSMSNLLPIADFPCIDFSSYRLPQGTISDDKTTCITTEPELTHDAAALLKLLQEQATLAPKPVVRITGTHVDWVYSWGNTRTDFDVTLDIMPLILQTATVPLSYISVQPVSNSSSDISSLRSWVQRFCNDTAESKSFTLERQVTNWDTCFLEREIRGIVVSTKYKGNIEITFPITNSKVVILKEAPGSSAVVKEGSKASWKHKWLGRPRASEANKPMISNNAIHAYEAVQVTWPYATSSSTSPSTPGSFSNIGRRCAVQSEQDWWTIWKEPIRNGVLNKKQGWVTVEDWKEVVMGGEVSRAQEGLGNLCG